MNQRVLSFETQLKRAAPQDEDPLMFQEKFLMLRSRQGASCGDSPQTKGVFTGDPPADPGGVSKHGVDHKHFSTTC